MNVKLKLKEEYMKIIISAKITEGYPKWRDAFVSADGLREKHGLKVLAWGHPKGDENKVYQVVEVESMELSLIHI